MIASQAAGFQPAINEGELHAQQREVQRLMGRCLLRLQQYERLMKAIVAHSDISGPAHAMEKIRAARIDDASTKTLGTLVRQLFGSSVVTEGADTAADATENEPEDVIHFATRMQLSLSAEDYVRMAAEFVQSGAFHDWMIYGIAPDGTVDWTAAGIVRALRGAANELAVGGWTPVVAAGRWIVERSPEQQPNKYGCASWRQVLHESRLFELRYRDVDGQRAAWYRVLTK